VKPHIPLVTLLIFFAPAATADDTVSKAVMNFLDSYIAGDFEAASKQLYCPAEYSDKKKEEEQRQLADELSRMSKEYGNAISYRPIQRSMYSAVMLGCGAPEDHETIKPIGMDLVAVDYENNKKGIIQIFYLRTNDGPVFGIVGIGEPSASPDSVGKQYKLYKELKNSPNKTLEGDAQ